jgi:hypothetical protein
MRGSPYPPPQGGLVPGPAPQRESQMHILLNSTRSRSNESLPLTSSCQEDWNGLAHNCIKALFAATANTIRSGSAAPKALEAVRSNPVNDSWFTYRPLSDGF